MARTSALRGAGECWCAVPARAVSVFSTLKARSPDPITLLLGPPPRPPPSRAAAPPQLHPPDPLLAPCLPPPRPSPPAALFPPSPPVRVSAPGRVVALGDVHGDLRKTVACLELAGLARRTGRGDSHALTALLGASLAARSPALAVPELEWVGGDATLVQLGDVLDRGDGELAILCVLHSLRAQAAAWGGAVWMLNGNHESLNVAGDFRYATSGALRACGLAAGLSQGLLARDPGAGARARRALLRPGGLLARALARNPTVLVVNDVAFAHGGILPVHVEYGLERINAQVAAWMHGGRGAEPDRDRSGGFVVSASASAQGRGDAAEAAAGAPPPPFVAMGDQQSVMWNRSYGRDPRAPPPGAREALERTLRALRVRGMVVGHTPQAGGANAAFEGRVWRLDAGLSAGVLDAQPQVLEIGGRAWGPGAGQAPAEKLPLRLVWRGAGGEVGQDVSFLPPA